MKSNFSHFKLRKNLFSYSILLFLLTNQSFAYDQYSKAEALTTCSQCLDEPQNRFCLDSSTGHYYCCNMAENTMFCSPGGTISCSHTKYSESLSRYRFCPQDQILCDNDESVQLYRSNVPLLSNIDENIEADGISSGKVCVYEVEAFDSRTDELVEITLEHVQNAKIGFDFLQSQPQLDWSLKNVTIDSGFLSKENCSMDANNCTKNMRGKHVYYLSGVAQKLYLTVISTARNDSSLQQLGETSFDIGLALREKTTSVWVYVGVTLALMAGFTYLFLKAMKWMESQHKKDEEDEEDEEYNQMMDQETNQQEDKKERKSENPFKQQRKKE